MNKKNEGVPRKTLPDKMLVKKTLPDKMLVNKPATIVIFILACLSVYNRYLTFILTFVELINDIYKLNIKNIYNYYRKLFKIKLTSYFSV